MRLLLTLSACVSLTACASLPPEPRTPAAPGSLVPLGQPVSVGRATATPLAVIEDSRCPENARCVWAGRLVVQTQVEGPGWRETLPLTLGEPDVTHGTTITLVSGQPEEQANRQTLPSAYRFAFEGGRELAIAALGQRVYADGPEVTPLEVLEDSRCPAGAQCVWTGRVRLKAAIHLGSGDQEHELALGEPVQVADGALELVEVRPVPAAGQAITPADYRFTFRFDGGL